MKKVIRNTSIYSLGIILPKAAGFILLPIYTRYLTPGDYGIISSMQVLQSVLAVLFSLCLERSIYRLYWDYKTEEEKRDFLGTLTLSIIALSFSLFLLLLIFKKYVELIYESIDFYPFYFYVIVTVFTSTFSLVPKIYLILKEKAGIYVLLSIVQFITNSSLIIWFIILKEEGAAGYLKGNMCGVILLLPIFIVISYKIINIKFNFSIIKDGLSFSLPLIPTIISAWILNLSDRIFIERYFSLHDVGIYSLGYQIAGLVILFTGAYSSAYSPVFFRLANSDNQVEARKQISMYNQIYVTAVIFICFVISFFAREVITLAFADQYLESYYIVYLISFSYLFSQVGSLIGIFFQQSKKMKANMIFAMSFAGINILLNFLLIPRFGIYGAAYATILSMSSGLFVAYSYAKKRTFFIPLRWKQIMPVVLLFIILVLLFQYWIKAGIYESLLIKIVIALAIFAVFIKRYKLQIKDFLTRELQ